MHGDLMTAMPEEMQELGVQRIPMFATLISDVPSVFGKAVWRLRHLWLQKVKFLVG